jgi:hypothetical protein
MKLMHVPGHFPSTVSLKYTQRFSSLPNPEMRLAFSSGPNGSGCIDLPYDRNDSEMLCVL